MTTAKYLEENTRHHEQSAIQLAEITRVVKENTALKMRAIKEGENCKLKKEQAALGKQQEAEKNKLLQETIAKLEAQLPPKLWASVWSMLETAIEQATTDASTFATHEKMLCALANRTADLYEGGRGYFEEADVLRLLQLSERLVRSPERPLGWEPTEPTCAPSALQNAVLNLLSKLPPFLIAC